MAIYLSYSSALELIRRERFLAGTPYGARCARTQKTGVPNFAPVRLRSLKECEADARGLHDQTEGRLCGLRLPVHVLVDSAGSRRASKGVVAHLWSPPFPRGMFATFCKDVFSATPEACFLQMAQKLDFAELVMLGFELCGQYTFGTNGHDVRRSHPATTSKAIASFIERASNRGGSRKAARAACMIADGSASPTETAQAMLMCLPRMAGGFGIPLPRLNRRIQLDTQQQALFGRHYYEADACWDDEKLIVEYDSNAFHTGGDRIASDSKRRNALQDMGYRIVTVTTEQLFNPKQFDLVCQQVEKSLGKRHNRQSVAYSWRTQRRLLRNTVLRPVGSACPLNSGCPDGRMEHA